MELWSNSLYSIMWLSTISRYNYYNYYNKKGRNEEEILLSVRKGDFEFDPEDWDKVSKEAKGLI